MKRNGGSQTHPLKKKNALNLLLQSCYSGIVAHEDVIVNKGKNDLF